MKCIECGATMTCERRNHRAKDLGLPNVVLCKTEVRRCPGCGEEEIVIPRLEDLNRRLAEMMVRKPARLAGEEIRFLRKCLGWSGTDFAKRAGVERETVSRWENSHEKIGQAADRFLRLAVAHWQPIEDYEQEDLDAIRSSAAVKLNIRMQCTRKVWAPVVRP